MSTNELLNQIQKIINQYGNMTVEILVEVKSDAIISNPLKHVTIINNKLILS